MDEGGCKGCRSKIDKNKNLLAPEGGGRLNKPPVAGASNFRSSVTTNINAAVQQNQQVPTNENGVEVPMAIGVAVEMTHVYACIDGKVK